VPRYGGAGRVGSLLFAAGTVVQVAVGRVPFLLALALALWALVALLRPERPARGAGVVLALAATLASPLAGLFLALAMLAWLLAALPRVNWWALAAGLAAFAPIAALELLFPGQGRMPFAPLDFAGTLVPTFALALVARQRALRIGLVLYAILVIGSYLVPSALGVNATRLGTTAGLGLAVALYAASTRARLLVAIAVVPLVLGQWVPARSALLGAYDPGTSRAYFAPLVAFLEAHDRPLARVEVVPLSTHWESDYVALAVPLARGWERQLDTADNPIFYDAGALGAGSYLAWLRRNAVRYVALSDAPLDYAGIAEARLVRAGVPGLHAVWHDEHWRVFAVAGAPAIVSGPGSLVAQTGARLVLRADRAGLLTVRVRGGTDWRVASGAAGVAPAAGGWIAVHARAAGQIVLSISP
jgi:hypothetical protein